MKKYLIVVSLTITSLFITTPALAQTAATRATVSTAAQKQDARLENLKKRADQAIDKRVASLNKLLTRIENDQKLTIEIKSALSSDIQSQITGLTSLKAKIDADSDLATARADAQSIVTNFRIYAVFVPKMRILIVINNLQAQATKMSGLTPKLQELINQAKTQGKDTTKARGLQDDINSKLSTINTQLTNDKTKITAVTISDVNGAQSTFVTVRQDLANVRSEFAQIRNDLAGLRGEFKISLRGKGSNSTPSATSK